MRILAASLITAVFVATVGLGWLFDYVYKQFIHDDSQTPITSSMAIEKLGADLQAMLNRRQMTELELTALVAAWPVDGNYQLSLLPFASVSLPENLKTELVAGEPLTLASEEDVATYYYLPAHQRLLVLTSPLMQEQTSADLKRYWFTGLFYLCLLLLMLLWLYPLVKRLLALRSAAKRFGQGKLEQRVMVGSTSYIRDLELEFNHMAQRIEDLIGDVKLLSSAVSHDLRTPLATIRFGIDTLQEEDDPALRKTFEARISKNVDEMIQLVEILLNYARLDQNLVSLDKTNVELGLLLHQLVQNHQQDEIHLELVMSNEGEARVQADKKYISMLFNNLLQNARQYCKSTIKVDINSDQNGITISVSDDGPGIDMEQRQQIVKPFVRGSSEHKGYGVGLAIVQRIVHWHSGRLEIDKDEALGGAKFKIWLPK